MDLTLIWFLLVGVLLIGYFVLDGFDFGVGMALPFLGKDNVDRRLIINTIGPVWDLNETWLIVAGACLFAAFPEWYATMFSGLYLAHPDAYYFGVAKVERDQVEDYARRKEWTVETAERWLSPVLNYDPASVQKADAA